MNGFGPLRLMISSVSCPFQYVMSSHESWNAKIGPFADQAGVGRIVQVAGLDRAGIVRGQEVLAGRGGAEREGSHPEQR